MTTHSVKRILISTGIILSVVSCGERRKESKLIWDKNIPRIGSQSSPRATDLNADGVLDIVMGAGKNEYQETDMGVIAMNGRTGEILWQQRAPDQVYGSATFLDITTDDIDDVFIGGRSPHFQALNGKTGDVLWEYNYVYENHPILKYAKFNFNNSVLVPDQNNDGLKDLLTINGGNSLAKPDSETDRYPGVMILFDAKSGNILAADTMPDGRESYMSPLVFVKPGHKDIFIVFGTGGETIDGNLYVGTLQDLKDQKLENSKIIAREKGHGFIAPPVLADITDDGIPDIISISHASGAFAVDGSTLSLVWKRQMPGTESSNSFAVGYFNDDDVPDFFTFVSKGKWPSNTGSLQMMLDGKDGTIGFMDSIGCTGFSSPVIYDLNRDGIDEAIISVNEFDCKGFIDGSPRTMENKLIAINFAMHSVQVIDQQQGFKNIFSTPWLGDLDDDGYLDVVHCQYFHYGDLLGFLVMRVKRISTPVKVKKTPAWGSYMGAGGDGFFPLRD